MRILIIEDEKETVESLKSSLESECFIVDTAEDGEYGLFMAQTNKYDTIILDFVLPRKNGQQICQELRQQKIDTPIIMLTVKDSVEDKVNLLSLGADDYLTKPFSFEELIARIRAILRRPNHPKNEILKIDNLIIDSNHHSVRRGSKEIYLTRKEFCLLEYLMRHIGVVLSRGKILENVWDINADPFSNTIETHILNVRKKIDSEQKTKLIHTIPGRGYKIDLSK